MLINETQRQKYVICFKRKIISLISNNITLWLIEINDQTYCLFYRQNIILLEIAKCKCRIIPKNY